MTDKRSENRFTVISGTGHEARQSDGDTLALLTVLAPPVDPPEGLFDAISAEIDALPEQASRTVRAEDGSWTRFADNLFKRMLFGDKVWIRTLYKDEETGERVYLMRCEPGAWLPAHNHERDEHVYVLEGQFVVGNTVIEAGDYQFAPAGSRHEKITSPTGCLSLIHG